MSGGSPAGAAASSAFGSCCCCPATSGCLTNAVGRSAAAEFPRWHSSSQRGFSRWRRAWRSGILSQAKRAGCHTTCGHTFHAECIDQFVESISKERDEYGPTASGAIELDPPRQLNCPCCCVPFGSDSGQASVAAASAAPMNAAPPPMNALRCAKEFARRCFRRREGARGGRHPPSHRPPALHPWTPAVATTRRNAGRTSTRPKRQAQQSTPSSCKR